LKYTFTKVTQNKILLQKVTQMDNKLYLTFDTICADIKNLKNHIESSNTSYDAILTISGGGLIPSRLLRTHMNIPIYSIGMSFYVDNKMQKEPILFQWLRDEEINFLKNKHVLIVDELSDTMGTLNLVINRLVNNGFITNNLGIAVLYSKKKKKKWSPVIDDFELNVNFFVSEFIEDVWVVFPWDNF
jgi:hypoxanthine phosphoribosyltransferase